MVISTLQINYKAIQKPFDPTFVRGDDVLLAVKSKYKILDNLDPATLYEISVSATTSAGRGPSITILEYTRPPGKESSLSPGALLPECETWVADKNCTFSVTHAYDVEDSRTKIIT